jgi:hypothetical protein
VQLKIPKDILSDLLKWLLTTRDNKCWQLYDIKGTLVYCWWEYQPEYKAVRKFLKKFKIEMSHF